MGPSLEIPRRENARPPDMTRGNTTVQNDTRTSYEDERSRRGDGYLDGWILYRCMNEGCSTSSSTYGRQPRKYVTSCERKHVVTNIVYSEVQEHRCFQ